MELREGINFDKENYTENPLAKCEYENCAFRNCNFANADVATIKFIECEFARLQFEHGEVTSALRLKM
jgi:uncharacterized protein YjbI with pentapeptide repeats